MALEHFKRMISVRSAVGASTLVLALGLTASPALAADSGCHTQTGNAAWTVVPAPNDPFGRVVGPTTGTLKAAVSAYITVFEPGPDLIHAESVEVWVLGPQDILIFDGDATFTPVPGEPVGTVSDALSLTVVGGTGKYAGATGTLEVTGTGYNLFGPNAGPGSSFFDVRYRGTICTTK